MQNRVLVQVGYGPLPSQANRAIRLKWRDNEKEFDGLILPQRIDIREEVCGGIEGRLSCVTGIDGISLTDLLGVPVAVQLVTDRGDLHSICGIVTDAWKGASDLGLIAYQLVIRDALSILERRVNTRIFRNQTVPGIVATLVAEWRRKSSTLASSFDLDISRLQRDRYRSHDQTIQFEESDADFIRRLCRREGIAWFIKAGKRNHGSGYDRKAVAHTLVLFERSHSLDDSSAGCIHYRSHDAHEQRDTITRLSSGRRIVPGSTRNVGWNRDQARLDHVGMRTGVDQGEAGNDLASLLKDARVDPPDTADSWDQYDQRGTWRADAHLARSMCIEGASNVRDLAVGHRIGIAGHPDFDRLHEWNRWVIVTSLHHRGENNLPKDLTERAQALFAASRWLFDSPPGSVSTQARPSAWPGTPENRYENTFSCISRDTPLTPLYDPRVHLPRVHPITGVVVCPEGDEVYCDELGRIRVRIEGLNADDHEHAKGAGTSGTPADSAAVPVSTRWAGSRFGESLLPRRGMEVILDFMNGDPDKMFVAGVFYNGAKTPAAFSNKGSLPANRRLSGMKTKEINGTRYNQLRFDDTTGQISSQLASAHASSELNLGYLTHPREEGWAEARGEGAELRSDANVAIRSGKALLISAWQRLNAAGGQLSRDEYLRLMQECMALSRSLGEYAAAHRGVDFDMQPQDELASTVKSWPDADGDGSTEQAAIGITAPAGISAATSKTIAMHAGGNVDSVAQGHIQFASAHRVNLQAGHGVAMFAHREGVSAIANQGKVMLQSQADDTQIESAKSIRLMAAEGQLAGTASDEVVFVTSGGAYLKLRGGDIELGCPGRFTVKAAGHTWDGPASMSADFPSFDDAALDRMPKLVRATDDEGVPGYDAEVRRATGQIVKGETDAAGCSEPIDSDQFEQLDAVFFKKKT
ncbi:type VI secretion system Vgr family protein [Trinickia symbiotica]|uniref:type VI secretion system Vgr family protein n=1 Tax=Trinickia symbiotica TaxID=863227 RepID=UPI002158FFB8|nr:type VI secretion system Vgr family protein [Trinickia symbiotica]